MERLGNSVGPLSKGANLNHEGSQSSCLLLGGPSHWGSIGGWEYLYLDHIKSLPGKEFGAGEELKWVIWVIRKSSQYCLIRTL